MPIDSIPAILSSVAVYFISYIPVLYILPIIGVEKTTLFVFLIMLIILSMLIGKVPQAVLGRLEFGKSNVLVLTLYLAFVSYALMSYAILGDQLNDIFTIRTLSILNPLFLLFAIACKHNKKDVIITTFLLSSIYFARLLLAILHGEIQVEQTSYLDIFFDLEEKLDAYQNVNMYIGLFVITNLFWISKSRLYYKIAAILMAAISSAGMFLVGGRASIVALAIVLFLYVSKLIIFKQKLRMLKNSLVLLLGVVIASVAISTYWIHLSSLLEQSHTAWRLSILFDNYDSSGRIFFFTKAIELFLTNGQTFFWGAGINSYPVFIGEPSRDWYPHNVLLELLCEFGIMGLILFLLPVSYVLYLRKKHLGTLYGDSPEERIAFLSCLYFWIIHMFTNNLGASWVLIFFSVFIMPSAQKTMARARSKPCANSFANYKNRDNVNLNSCLLI